MNKSSLIILITLFLISPLHSAGVDGTRPSEEVINSLSRYISNGLETVSGKKFKKPVAAFRQTGLDFEKYLNLQLEKQLPKELEIHYGELLFRFGFYKNRVLQDPRSLLKMLYKSQTAAYFDPEKGDFYYLYPEMEINSLGGIMAHELWHGVQHHYFNLNEFVMNRVSKRERNDDEIRARHCLVEGDATLRMVEWSLFEGQKTIPTLELLEDFLDKLPGEKEEDIQQALRKGSEQLGLNEKEKIDLDRTLSQLPRFLISSLYFPYHKGSHFALALRKIGEKTLEEAFTIYPPRSTEQILHPEKYLERDQPTLINLPFSKFPLRGFRLVYSNQMGEFGWQQIFKEFEIPLWEQASRGWDGDLYGFWYSPIGKRYALISLSYWDSPDDAVEAFQALEKVLSLQTSTLKNGIELHGQFIYWVQGFRDEEEKSDLFKFCREKTSVPR